MNKIKDWINDADDNVELLPFFHTTTWKTFEFILDSKKILNNSDFPPDEKANCEKIAYLFYGLPYYLTSIPVHEKVESTERLPRNTVGIANSTFTNDLPVAFLFNSSICNDVDRIYPFDTGAFYNGRFSSNLNIAREEILNYCLSVTDGIEIKRLIRRYYKSNENYCYGKASEESEAKHPNEEYLLSLLKSTNISENDMRTKAIEAHILKEIIISSSNLLAIVLPQVKFNTYKYYIKDKIDNLTGSNIEIINYNELLTNSPERLRGAVIQQVFDYYKESANISFDAALMGI